MRRSPRSVGPRVVATALFACSLFLFGGVAFSLHPAWGLGDGGALGQQVSGLLTASPQSGDASLAALVGPQTVAETPEPVSPAPEPTWVSYTVKKGDTLGRILPAHGMPTQAVLAAAKEHHDLSKLRVGAVLEFLMPPGRRQTPGLRMPQSEPAPVPPLRCAPS